jgi:hypothetical protein
MSRRSKRRHHQTRKNTPSGRPASAVAERNTRESGRGRTVLVVVGLAVVGAAVLLAVNMGGRPKGEEGGARGTNLGSLAATAPTATPVAATASVVSVAGTAGPKIVFATPVHDFGQIKGGAVVKHAYVFTNVGGATLEVTNVHASCGCTTAGEWTRQVAPGMTGSIPIQFNSGNFSGAVGKSITVTCNDTSQPTVMLQIKGNIWKPIDVTPQFAVLNVTSDAPSNATTVRIVNNEETPLTLGAPESSNPAFGVELRTNKPGKEFHLIVRTAGPLPAGNAQGQITVRTSSTNLPAISLTAWANVQQAVTVMPAQVTLPAGPLANPVPSTITIRNNGTNTLALSEPVGNAKGVEVRVQEIQPGRVFTLTANFPPGFEVAQGEKVELSVKTSHPQFPVIKVPVTQARRPAPLAVPVGTASALTPVKQ